MFTGDARQPAGLQVPSRLKDNQPVFRQQQQQQQQQLNQQNQPQVLNQQQVPNQVKQQLEGVNVQHQQSANAAPPPAASRRGKVGRDLCVVLFRLSGIGIIGHPVWSA